MFTVQHGHGTSNQTFADREEAIRHADRLADTYRTRPFALSEDSAQSLVWPVVLDEAGRRVYVPRRLA